MRHDVRTSESVGGLLDSRREAILSLLEHRLRATGNSLGKDPAVMPSCIARADAILTATVHELGRQSQHREQPYRPDAAGGAPADTAVDAAGDAGGEDTPSGGAGVLMDVVLKELLQVAVADPRLLPDVSGALTVLHRNLASQIHESGDSYDRYIVRTAEDARRRERRQLAREVHDELGHEISIAMHQLELSELYGENSAEARAARVGTVREHLASAMLIVRRLIAEFSEATAPVDLEDELVSFADAAGHLRTAVHVRVTGNQRLLPDRHRRELFLIIREALLNVFAHAAAERAVVLVDITSEAITAVVEDNGGGLAADAPTSSSGFGLFSMRERAGALAGSVTVSSSPDGTRVDVRIPLP